MKKKIVLLMMAVMLLGIGSVAYAEETADMPEAQADAQNEAMKIQDEELQEAQAVQNDGEEEETEIRTVKGSEIGASVFRSMKPEYSVLAEKGWGKTIEVRCSMLYDSNQYELYTDGGLSYSINTLKDGADSVMLSGNTSENTKLLSKDFLYSNGRCNLVEVQIGEDEAAEEITITIEFGAWNYYLRNKETGEIICVTGDEEEQISLTLKVVDRGKDCDLERKIVVDKASVEPGGETAVRMEYELVFDTDQYTYYNGENYDWYLGLESCTVSGNTSEKTLIENRNDYANTRYLVVGEDETAEELTITMECGAWTYYVKDKATGEILRIHNDGIQDHQMLQITVKVGAEEENEISIENRPGNESENTIYVDDESENIIYADDESKSEDRDEVSDNQPITFANTVTGVNGAKTVSTIDGIYQVTNVAGVAVITPKEQVETAVGMPDGDSKVRLYVCNNQNQKARTALEEAFAPTGKQVLTTFNLDMYLISKSGQVDKIYNTTSKVRVVIGIPDRYKNVDRPCTIGIIGRDGTFHMLEDLDNDPNTITIETDQFGVMALMN